MMMMMKPTARLLLFGDVLSMAILPMEMKMSGWNPSYFFFHKQLNFGNKQNRMESLLYTPKS